MALRDIRAFGSLFDVEVSEVSPFLFVILAFILVIPAVTLVMMIAYTGAINKALSQLFYYPGVIFSDFLSKFVAEEVLVNKSQVLIYTFCGYKN